MYTIFHSFCASFDFAIVLHMFAHVFLDWGSWEEAGGSFEGSLGTLGASWRRHTQGKSRKRMMTIVILRWFWLCVGECVNHGFGVAEGRDFKILIYPWFYDIC